MSSAILGGTGKSNGNEERGNVMRRVALLGLLASMGSGAAWARCGTQEIGMAYLHDPKFKDRPLGFNIGIDATAVMMPEAAPRISGDGSSSSRFASGGLIVIASLSNGMRDMTSRVPGFQAQSTSTASS